MKRFLSTMVCIWAALQGFAQDIERPKLVVGIVVDQMRWDYLYRYYAHYGNGGFKRLLDEGFSCENAMINYLPSVTAIGHSTIYTGSVPAIHGIAGNDWIDQITGKRWYCTDDSTVNAVGSTSDAGKMSPRNLLATTITDELKIASNFRSKVIGVSLKDRAAILPAGHTPDGAYWLDDSNGSFITSTYYKDELPDWVKKFNATNPIQKYLDKGWHTLKPINQYIESSKDNEPWEGILSAHDAPVFPYDLKKAYAKSKSSFRNTPFGNSITLEMAKAAIDGEKLGQGTQTDFLAINCASTDYVGHLVGTHAIEIEDTYLRLDKDLEDLFNKLDKTVGKGKYLVFLSADHGAAHAAGFSLEHKMFSGNWMQDLTKNLNAYLASKFKLSDAVKGIDNQQVMFNYDKIDAAKVDFETLKKAAVWFLERQPLVQFAVDHKNVSSASIPEPIKQMIINGYNNKRSGEIEIIPNPGYLGGYKTGTSHSMWNPYDTHIPLVFMGWGIKHGTSNTQVNMTDIAPTLAALLHIQMPNGCIGKPITEVTHQ